MAGARSKLLLFIVAATVISVCAADAVDQQLRGSVETDITLPPPGVEHRDSSMHTTASSPVDYCLLHSTSWIQYSTPYLNTRINSATNIQSSKFNTGSTTWSATSTVVPNYDRTFTAANIAALNARPKASTDFRTGGVTTAVAGNFYAFGADIGYTTKSCTLGYWPPGPSCATGQNAVTANFRVDPAPEAGTGCYAYGALPGVFVNGAQLWSYTDMNTYNSGNVWHNLAVKFEWWDLDICLGHAANGNYHHHR